MKVYVITKGDYSNYHICAVSTDKKKAEILRKAHEDYEGLRKVRIETYETDQFLTELESGMKVYDCAIKEDGEIIRITDIRGLDYLSSSDFKIREVVKSSIYHVYVWAKDEDHALKIASDKYAEYKANKEGI